MQAQNPAVDSSRFSGTIKALVRQPDGKLIFGGDFRNYKGVVCGRIIRLLPDGSIDKTFLTGSGFDSEVNALLVQPDGKILIGGRFTCYNGKSNVCNRIVRLNADGSIDSSFSSGKGFGGEVLVLHRQADGKIVVGGGLKQYNGTPCSGLIRLTATGSFDSEFQNFNGINGAVHCVAPLPGGKLMVGGHFTHHGVNRIFNIARLNQNGSYDNTFTKEGFSGIVYCILPLPGGKLLVGGDLHRFAKIACYDIFRLNSNGTADLNFPVAKPAKDYAGSCIRQMVLQTDGKIVVAGDFYFYENNPAGSIARLGLDDTYDSSFEAGSGFHVQFSSGKLYVLLPLPSGDLIAAGRFQDCNNLLRNCVAMLNKDGKPMPAFAVAPRPK